MNDFILLSSQKYHSLPTALSNTSIRHDHADTPEVSSFLSPPPLMLSGRALTLSWVDFPQPQILAWLHRHNDFGLHFFLPLHLPSCKLVVCQQIERGDESEIHSSAFWFNKRNLYVFRSLCPTLILLSEHSGIISSDQRSMIITRYTKQSSQL